jgi:hypothetical protein
MVHESFGLGKLLAGSAASRCLIARDDRSGIDRICGTGTAVAASLEPAVLGQP